MIILDYSDKRPIYEQIVDKMQILIANGALEPDEKLPSVRSLAVELSINPNTIQRAYSELERSGFIYSVKGRGNFVADSSALLRQKKEALLADIRRYIQYGRELGVKETEFITVVSELYPNVQDVQKEGEYD